ncbi:hypothetical protein [Chengkuizengella marina]|uniref:Uncharacterized protein n=1 Tax=Chengkuizengella marina TaxID=2507566 RepID=A0A6N9Q320_9BACL|nr:hypothetical protein [Chengkuizengella marina]NBI29174.1 hypothetical protein [Chengkuizengella marina]
MCEKCYILKKIFKVADSNPHLNYFPTIKFIEELVLQERIEVYAGDCPLNDIEQLLNEEKHYTVCHYLRCKDCFHYFFIGACIRGTPIYKTMVNFKKEELENMLWGQHGTFFETR